VTLTWRGVVFSQNATVDVVVAREQAGDARPGEAVLATTNQKDADIFRMLLRKGPLMLKSEKELTLAADSLSLDPDATVAGFLFFFLTRYEIGRNPDACTTLLSRFIHSPSVPPGEWNQIFTFLVADYHLSSVQRQSKLLDELATFAQDSDPLLAVTAIRAISKLASRHVEVAGAVPNSTLAAKYISLVRSGALARSADIESSLRITYR
jgi:hypothetical protein